MLMRCEGNLQIRCEGVLKVKLSPTDIQLLESLDLVNIKKNHCKQNYNLHKVVVMQAAILLL